MRGGRATLGGVRRALLAFLAFAIVVGLLSSPAIAQPGEGVALLPLRSRGLSPGEHRRISARVAASFKQSRSDVIGPDELAARLAKDERRRAAIEEARRLTAEGAEKSLNMESGAAIAAYDRAIAIWLQNFGEWVDPAAMADCFVRRAAERLDSDPAAARADLFAAVTIAPDRQPSIDDFPPKVVELYEAARADRARDSFPADDSRSLTALGAALGTASVAVMRAERGDRYEDGVGLDVAVFAVRAPELPPKARRTSLPAGSDGGERIDALVDALAGRGTAITSRDGDVRTNPTRTPPPIRRPRRPNDKPLWKNPWVWVGAGAAAALGAGYGAYSLQQQKEEEPGFKVILAPAPPEDS